MYFCVSQLTRSIGLFFAKTIFHRRIRFFYFSHFLIVPFQCTTIETVTIIVLSENNNVKKIFF